MMLLLHVLMLSLLSGGSARVVDDFEQECGQFFAGQKSPTTFSGSEYKQICQTLDYNVYYATYYDTSNKIPVYSAYKFEGQTDCERQKMWFIEPQLDDINKGPNMAFEGSVGEDQRGLYQALNDDYEYSGYDRGHLVPVSQVRSQICSDATFTLTNAAPQDPSFNQGQWKVVEEEIAVRSKKCLSQHYSVYIVTGVVPGASYIKNRVNVPSYFWTAFCCLDHNNRCSPSGGIIGNNDSNSIIRRMNVTDLERELQTLHGTEFRIFQE